MAELEELKKKLAPLFDAEKGLDGPSMNPYESYMASSFSVYMTQIVQLFCCCLINFCFTYRYQMVEP